MPLTTGDHVAIQRLTKDLRNAGARRARAGQRLDRYRDVQLVSTTWLQGERVLLTVTKADGDRPHVLHLRAGRWRST